MAGDITITDGAVEKIRQLLLGGLEGQGLRVKIVAGGCSGFEYKTVIDVPAPEDEVLRGAALECYSIRKALPT